MKTTSRAFTLLKVALTIVSESDCQPLSIETDFGFPQDKLCDSFEKPRQIIPPTKEGQQLVDPISPAAVVSFQERELSSLIRKLHSILASFSFSRPLGRIWFSITVSPEDYFHVNPLVMVFQIKAFRKASPCKMLVAAS